jgi:hypothetical protein
VIPTVDRPVCRFVRSSDVAWKAEDDDHLLAWAERHVFGVATGEGKGELKDRLAFELASGALQERRRLVLTVACRTGPEVILQGRRPVRDGTDDDVRAGHLVLCPDPHGSPAGARTDEPDVESRRVVLPEEGHPGLRVDEDVPVLTEPDRAVRCGGPVDVDHGFRSGREREVGRCPKKDAPRGVLRRAVVAPVSVPIDVDIHTVRPAGLERLQGQVGRRRGDTVNEKPRNLPTRAHVHDARLKTIAQVGGKIRERECRRNRRRHANEPRCDESQDRQARTAEHLPHPNRLLLSPGRSGFSALPQPCGRSSRSRRHRHGASDCRRAQ